MSALTANQIATAVTGGQGVTDQGQLAAITAATLLLSGGAAALLGANPIGAATAAENETLNNTCAAAHNCGTLASALADTGRAAWNTALGVVQSVPNLVNGALPGYPDYVPFLNGAMLPYDDPDFGSLVSAVGTIGAASLVGGSSGGSTVATEAATNSSLGTVIGSFNAVNPGPLSDSLAETFAGGNYTAIALTQDTVLYRAGTAQVPLGQFFVDTPPQGIIQSRIDSAVLPTWPSGATSPIDSSFAVKIPAGTTVYVGNAGSQGGFYVGGTQQIAIPKPWTINGVTVQSTTPLK